MEFQSKTPMLTVTPEMIAALPEEDRAPWQETLDRQRQRENFIQDAIEREDWRNALAMCESQERAQVLIEAGRNANKRQLRKLLKEWWSISEAWSGDDYLRTEMFSLLRRVAPVIVNGPIPRGRKLVVYRGNLGEFPSGGSWTLDRVVAEKFASMAKGVRGMFLGIYREDGWPTIWRGIVDANDILGYFNDRAEQEIVTDVVRGIDAIAEAQR